MHRAFPVAATAKLFDGDWLNTGDLRYLADGELIITGRGLINFSLTREERSP